MRPRLSLRRQIDYNLALLAQAQAVIAQFDGRADQFGQHAGPHLRHVMDHYDAFLDGLERGMVDYESRARHRDTERWPDCAKRRLSALCSRLRELPDDVCDTLAVVVAGGLEGEELSASQSSTLRELQFLALHAIHHYAVLCPALHESGLQLPADFGKAPGTIRYEHGQGALQAAA